MTEPTNHAGKTFGSWTVLEYTGKQYWLCRCKCGAELEIYSGNLVRGNTTQCRSCSKTKHAMSKSRIYTLWAEAKKRECGISDLWKNDFKAFYNYSVLHGYTINKFLSRKDDSLPIQPGNIVWGKMRGDRTRKARKLITINGKTKGLSEWARSVGISRQAFSLRLQNKERNNDPEYLLAKKDEWKGMNKTTSVYIRMYGYTIEEIAGLLECPTWTVLKYHNENVLTEMLRRNHGKA